MRSSTTVSKLAYWLSLVVAAILALLPFHALLTTWAGSNFGHLDLIRIWKEITIVILVIPSLWIAWQTPKLKTWLLNSWLVWLCGLYILLHLILGLWAYHDHQVNSTALIYALLINLRFIGFFIVCFIVAASHSLLKKYWGQILVIPGLIVIGLGLLQRFLLPYDFLKHFGYGPKTIPAYQTVDASLDFRRIQSTLRGSNPLGAYLVLVIPAFLVVLKNRRVLQAVGVAAGLIAMFFSYSRSGWIGLAISLLLLGWWASNSKNQKRLVLASLVALVIVGLGTLALRSNQSAQETLFHIKSSSASSTSSNADRLTGIEHGLSDVVHQPQGRGPGTAGPASLRNNQPARIAENYYIQIAQEVGAIGLVMFLAINCLVAWQLWQQRDQHLSRLLLASLIGISFINLVSHAWADDTLSLLWWGLAGIALAPILKLSKNT